MLGAFIRRTSCGYRRSFLLPAIAGLLFAAPREDAVLTTYTNRAAWQAAAASLGTIQTEGFEGLPTGTLPVGGNQLGLIELKIELVGTTTTSGASISGTSPIAGTRELSLNADEAFRLYTVSFGSEVTAFGFDFTGAATGGIAVLRVDGQEFAFGAASNGFFGFTSTTPVPNVMFADQAPGTPSEVFESDQYSFVTVVPEPTTVAIFAAAGVASFTRRRRR